MSKTTFGIVSNNSAILSHSKEMLIDYIDNSNDEFDSTWRGSISKNQIVENPRFSPDFLDGADIQWVGDD